MAKKKRREKFSTTVFDLYPGRCVRVGWTLGVVRGYAKTGAWGVHRVLISPEGGHIGHWEFMEDMRPLDGDDDALVRWRAMIVEFMSATAGESTPLDHVHFLQHAFAWAWHACELWIPKTQSVEDMWWDVSKHPDLFRVLPRGPWHRVKELGRNPLTTMGRSVEHLGDET
jgi:hypothetical protein